LWSSFILTVTRKPEVFFRQEGAGRLQVWSADRKRLRDDDEDGIEMSYTRTNEVTVRRSPTTAPREVADRRGTTDRLLPPGGGGGNGAHFVAPRRSRDRKEMTTTLTTTRYGLTTISHCPSESSSVCDGSPLVRIDKTATGSGSSSSAAYV